MGDVDKICFFISKFDLIWYSFVSSLALVDKRFAVRFQYNFTYF